MRVDYDRHGRTYAQHRRTDPRIAARIHAALGAAPTFTTVRAAPSAARIRAAIRGSARRCCAYVRPWRS